VHLISLSLFFTNVIVKNVLLISLLLLSFPAGNSQTFKRAVRIDTKIHSGLSLPFYDALNYLIKDDVYAFDIAVSFPAYGKDFWEKLYGYPVSGFGASYWSLGNDEVLGKAYALYAFLNLPIYRPSDRFSINYQGSAGLAYVTRKFDIYSNHLNRAIGSHANLYIRLGIDSKIRLYKNCDLDIGVGVTHFSNGKTRSPNYGINAGTLSFGLNYLFKNDNVIKDPEIPVLQKKYIQTLIYSAGIKVYDNLYGSRYFISSLSYNIDYQQSQKRKLGLGADFFYDGAISEALTDENGKPDRNFSDLIRLGLHVSYAIRYKQVVMGIQPGYYFYSKYTDMTLLYSRIFLQYLITNHLISRIAIKSHFGKADFIEWGIGYSW
jgi:hypothetical protein